MEYLNLDTGGTGATGASNNNTTSHINGEIQARLNHTNGNGSIIVNGDHQHQEETSSIPSPIEILPPEMLVEIMGYLDSKFVLKSCMLVSKNWNLVSKQAILARVNTTLIPAGSRQELSTHLIGSRRRKIIDSPVLVIPNNDGEVASRESPSREDDTNSLYEQKFQSVQLLFLFEKTHYRAEDDLALRQESVKSLMYRISNTSSERCLYKSINPIISKEFPLVFMNCHELIIHPSYTCIKFMAKPQGREEQLSTLTPGASVPFPIPPTLSTPPPSSCYPSSSTSAPCASSSNSNGITRSHSFNSRTTQTCTLWKEYGICCKKMREIPALKGNVSVYEDNILIKGLTSKTIIWMKVVEVNHIIEKVILDMVREIFTPFYIQSFIFFNHKIYITYANCRYLGLWKSTTDELITSDQQLIDGRYWTFNRINNLIFLLVKESRSKKCMVFDGNRDDIVLHTIEISNLIKSICPRRKDHAYGKVQNLYSFNNLFIAVCTPVQNQPQQADDEHDEESEGEASAPMLVLACPMKKDPEIQDFTDQIVFKELFYVEKTETNKLMGEMRSVPIYFNNSVMLLGNDDGGNFVFKFLRLRR